MGGQSYLYGTFYRPPNSPVSIWSDIEYSIDLAFNTKISKIIITGDFNANLLTNNYQSEYLINIMNMYNMTQLIEEPTHFTEETCTLLDVIIVSDTHVVTFLKKLMLAIVFWTKMYVIIVLFMRR